MQISNVIFDELKVGQSASLTRRLTAEDIELFAIVSGDVNPAHMDPQFAEQGFFHSIIGHGFWSGSLFSTLLGTELPGPGTIYLSQSMEFLAPVKIGDEVTAQVTCLEKVENKHQAVFKCELTNGNGKLILKGEARVLVPTEKIQLERPSLPQVTLTKKDHFSHLRQACQSLSPLRTAVVHPVSTLLIETAFECHKLGLLHPVLVGPKSRIELAASEANIDISAFEIVDTPHSHAAAQQAVELAVSGQVSALMKGDLGTHELMAAVVDKSAGLHTDRRMSHCYVIFAAHHKGPMIITDAALNIAPDLMTKADICQNAIDLAIAMGIQTPKIAVLAAVEKVNPLMQATLDAAALSKMADRGQIAGALVDGPLAFDNAFSREAAVTKGIKSEVAGQADIFLAPDLEAGNILAKQLIFQGNAEAAGLVLGARVPIILTSRSDSLETRIASATLARLFEDKANPLKNRTL